MEPGVQTGSFTINRSHCGHSCPPAAENSRAATSGQEKNMTTTGALEIIANDPNTPDSIRVVCHQLRDLVQAGDTCPAIAQAILIAEYAAQIAVLRASLPEVTTPSP